MKNQQVFDQLLAKGMKVIYSDEAAPKIVQNVAKRDPVTGLKNTTEAVVGKLKNAGEQAQKPIPREMMPDLSLALMGQISELVNASGKAQVGEEHVLKAFELMSKEQMQRGLKSGRMDKGQIQALAQKAQPVQQPTQQPTAQPTQQGAPDPFNPTSTMSQKLEGGLL